MAPLGYLQSGLFIHDFLDGGKARPSRPRLAGSILQISRTVSLAVALQRASICLLSSGSRRHVWIFLRVPLLCASSTPPPSRGCCFVSSEMLCSGEGRRIVWCLFLDSLDGLRLFFGNDFFETKIFDLRPAVDVSCRAFCFWQTFFPFPGSSGVLYQVFHDRRDK